MTRKHHHSGLARKQSIGNKKAAKKAASFIIENIICNYFFLA